MFGEWYQKTNKTEDTNKLTLLVFKIIAILHNTRLATSIKLLETVSKGLFRNRSQNSCQTLLDCRCTAEKLSDTQNNCYVEMQCFSCTAVLNNAVFMDLPTAAGFLCDKTAVLGVAIKGRFCTYIFTPLCSFTIPTVEETQVNVQCTKITEFS
jgi:hypothetical protein